MLVCIGHTCSRCPPCIPPNLGRVSRPFFCALSLLLGFSLVQHVGLAVVPNVLDAARLIHSRHLRPIVPNLPVGHASCRRSGCRHQLARREERRFLSGGASGRDHLPLLWRNPGAVKRRLLGRLDLCRRRTKMLCPTPGLGVPLRRPAHHLILGDAGLDIVEQPL